MKTLRRGSSVFVGDMADLIASYGSERGVDAEGIEHHVSEETLAALDRFLERCAHKSAEGQGAPARDDAHG